MKRLLALQIPKPGKPIELPEGEARHATQVLRLRSGDRVEILDGSGHSVLAELKIRGESVIAEFIENRSIGSKNDAQRGIWPITLELCILKGDAMEWAIEKAVKLGVQELTPVISAFTVVQLNKKGPQVFQERWQKLADQALKQCGRLNRLSINAPLELPQLFLKYPTVVEKPRLWCDEQSRDTAPPLGSWLGSAPSGTQAIRLLIGPEGGFNENERELISRECLPVSLGPLVLRAETAAIYCASLLSSYFQNLDFTGRK